MYFRTRIESRCVKPLELEHLIKENSPTNIGWELAKEIIELHDYNIEKAFDFARLYYQNAGQIIQTLLLEIKDFNDKLCWGMG